jgi:hypothetical protein
LLAKAVRAITPRGYTARSSYGTIYVDGKSHWDIDDVKAFAEKHYKDFLVGKGKEVKNDDIDQIVVYKGNAKAGTKDVTVRIFKGRGNPKIEFRPLD